MWFKALASQCGMNNQIDTLYAGRTEMIGTDSWKQLTGEAYFSSTSKSLVHCVLV